MENRIIKGSYNALTYLKQSYVLYAIDNKVIVYKDKDMIVLYNEKWHSKLLESDFLDSFQDSTFQLIEDKKEFEISKEKDEEYYQWRSHYL